MIGACEPRAGVCVGQGAAPEEDFGQSCSVTDGAGDNPCAGLCVDVTSELAFCSHRCVFGESSDCSLKEGVRGGCLVATPGGSIGDTGYCAPLCNTHADCAAFERECEPFGDAVLEGAFGAAGACTGEATSVSVGGDAGVASDAGS